MISRYDNKNEESFRKKTELFIYSTTLGFRSLSNSIARQPYKVKTNSAVLNVELC